jgi:hypothetical protein
MLGSKSMNFPNEIRMKPTCMMIHGNGCECEPGDLVIGSKPFDVSNYIRNPNLTLPTTTSATKTKKTETRLR